MSAGSGQRHDHAHELKGASKRSLIIALVLISAYMVAAVVGALISGSLALIADAARMLTNAAAIATALFAMWLTSKEASVGRTYGYFRTEIMAALISALLPWLIVGSIMWEAYLRFVGGEQHIESLPMLIVGVGGLVVNLVSAYILHRSAERSLNVEGAFQLVMLGLVGSVAVVISAIVILTLGWTITDPILSVLIGILIMVSSWRLVAKEFRVILEGTPEHIDVYRLCSDIEGLEGVTVIHDVHVWTITPGSEAFTAHVVLDPSYEGDPEELLKRMQKIPRDKYGIGHVTIQLERSADGCTERHHVDHLEHAFRPRGM